MAALRVPKDALSLPKHSLTVAGFSATFTEMQVLLSAKLIIDAKDKVDLSTQADVIYRATEKHGLLYTVSDPWTDGTCKLWVWREGEKPQR